MLQMASVLECLLAPTVASVVSVGTSYAEALMLGNFLASI
jgi:hypothetical protein